MSWMCETAAEKQQEMCAGSRRCIQFCENCGKLAKKESQTFTYIYAFLLFFLLLLSHLIPPGARKNRCITATTCRIKLYLGQHIKTNVFFFILSPFCSFNCVRISHGAVSKHLMQLPTNKLLHGAQEAHFCPVFVHATLLWDFLATWCNVKHAVSIQPVPTYTLKIAAMGTRFFFSCV